MAKNKGGNKKKQRSKYISKGGTTGAVSRAVVKLVRRQRALDGFRKAANKMKALQKRRPVYAYVEDNEPHTDDGEVKKFKRERITKVRVKYDKNGPVLKGTTLL